MDNKTIHMVTFILLIVGGLNWLLVGALDINLVTAIFGQWDMVVKAIYVLVGLSAIYEVVSHKGCCKLCA